MYACYLDYDQNSQKLLPRFHQMEILGAIKMTNMNK